MPSKNNKIMINLSDIFQSITVLKKIGTEISNCSPLAKSDMLTDELSVAYSKMGDNTLELLNELELYVNSLTSATETAYNMYQATNEEKYKDLEDLINYLFDLNEDVLTTVTDGGFFNNDDNAQQAIVLSADEYMVAFNEMNIFFDEQYTDIIEEFKSKLLLQYQNFLSKNVPVVLNSMVEDIYARNANNNFGSNDYNEGLNDFKNNFSSNVCDEYNVNLNNYDIMNSNIPIDIWNNANDYQKSLLLLTYHGDFDGLQDVFERNISNSFNDKYSSSRNIPILNNTFNLLNLANNFYTEHINEVVNSDDPEGSLKKIIEDYKNVVNSSIMLPGDNALLLEILNPVGADYTNKSNAWYNTLKELGYLKNVNGDFDSDTIYQTTNNFDFLLGVMKKDGEKGLRDLFNNFYGKLGLGDEGQVYLESFFDYNYGGGISSFNNLLVCNGIVDGIKGPLEDLCNDKSTLDVSKQNYKLSLLEALDTTSVKDDDVNKAKDKLGNDAKYLEDWQIKAYALLNLIDPKYAELILDDTLYYNIQSGRGYDYAKEQVYQMTGETYRQIAIHLLKNEMLGNILGDTYGTSLGSTYAILSGAYDGLYSSVEGVFEFGEGLLDIFGVKGDDRMNANDYRKSYLQQFLSGNYSLLDTESDKEFYDFLESKKTQLGILKTEYNVSNSVGNMAIPMLLSAFVSPNAASAWMFASVTGNEKKQMLIDGREKNAVTYLEAATKGLLAVGSERMLGALKGIGGKQDDILGIFKNYNNYSNFGKFMAGTLSNQVNEVKEELFENAANYVIDYVFEGKTPETGDVIKETWETAYTTFLSTPLLNLMGGKFQDSNLSLMNRQTKHNIDGIDATYSQAELLNYTDDKGNVDKAKFMDFLRKNGRLSTMELDQKTVQNFKTPGVSGVAYNPKNNNYVVTYQDGHTETTETIAQINGHYYTKEQVDTYNEAIEKFSTTAELDSDTIVTYSSEEMQNAKDTLLSFAKNDIEREFFTTLGDEIANQMGRGNPNIENEYKALIRLFTETELAIDKNSSTGFAPYNNTFYYAPGEKLDARILVHELAHAMHYNFDTIELGPDETHNNIPLYDASDGNYYLTVDGQKYNYSSILEKTRQRIKDGKYENFNDYTYDRVRNKVNFLLQEDLKNNGQDYNEVINNKIKEFNESLHDEEFEERFRKLYDIPKNDIITEEQIYKAAELAVRSKYKRDVMNSDEQYTLIRCLSDIVDSVMGGDHDYGLIASHGLYYYGGRELHSDSNAKGVGNQFKEVVAQVIPILQLSPQVKPILYDMFGDEYMNMIMAEVDKIYSGS